MDTTTEMKNTETKVTEEQAMAHVKGLLEFIGEDVDREGLIKTPHRVINAMRDHFSGYNQNPKEYLKRTFSEVEGYNELVVVSDIELHSHCEHHMVPILGKAHVAYIPDKRIVGISKLARLVDLYAKRLQTQEAMTAQIADTIERVLKPKGVAIVIDAAHQCMSSRGVHKTETSTVTSRMLGAFRENPKSRMEFMNLIAL